MPKLHPNFPFDDGNLVYKERSPKTNPQWGKKPSERSVQELISFGVINLDKPPNLTSHEVSAIVARILGVEKAAHGGTLDPGVSGVLPIALERATPITRTWLSSDKEYVIVMRLHGEVPSDTLLKTIKEFEGEIYQRPPLRSAVVRRTRVRKIYEIEVLEVLGRDVLMRVRCEAGTYMRKLCTDIGDVLGVGAHMIDLRRTKSGPFTEDDTLKTLHDLIDAWEIYKETGDDRLLREVVLPAEVGVLHLPKIVVNDGAVGAITYGAQLYVPGVVALTKTIRKGDLVAIFTIKGELVALAKTLMSADEVIESEKGQVTEETRVLMPRDVYPPLWRRKQS